MPEAQDEKCKKEMMTMVCAMLLVNKMSLNKAMQILQKMPSKMACKYGPYGKNDGPCVVWHANCEKPESEKWQSKKAAQRYYAYAAKMVEGSERERYLLIADFLKAGCTEVCDNNDHMTKQMLDMMVLANPAYEDLIATPQDYEYARRHYTAA